jgi:peptide/nickel transport system substrate-binding protein
MFELAIDRQAILDETVRLLAPTTSPLDNTMWMAYGDHYESHYEDLHDPAAAEQLLVENGCGRDGQVYVCDGRVMSFVWLSTNDDPDRQTIFEMVRDDLGAIGVEIVSNLRAPSDFVTRDVLFGGPDVWQLANFSWRAGSDPSETQATYLCGDSDLNVNRYCSPQVETLVGRAATTLDPDERAALYNQADLRYLADDALIPLYQKPEMMVWSAELDGPTSNFSTSTDMWNSASWTGPTSVAVALPSEPAELNPLATNDESANRILATLLYGAFGMDPTLTQVPVLVDSVEILER